MIKRRLLSYDIPQLTKVFKKDFPQLVTMAEESESAALFKEALRSFVFSRIDRTVGGSNMGNAVAKRILLLIEHDGMMVSELSTGEEMPVRTITCLWQFLAGKLEEDVSPDFFIDLYRQFELLEKPEEIVPDRSLVKRQMNRWPTGLDEEVMAIRHSASCPDLSVPVYGRDELCREIRQSAGMVEYRPFPSCDGFQKPDGTELFPWRFPVGWNDGPVGTCS